LSFFFLVRLSCSAGNRRTRQMGYMQQQQAYPRIQAPMSSKEHRCCRIHSKLTVCCSLTT
jgi:hypothetical protein